jgi:hypothetical protein
MDHVRTSKVGCVQGGAGWGSIMVSPPPIWTKPPAPSPPAHGSTPQVHRIFVTCLSADCVTGLPGLLCTVSASREAGHEMADIPVHLYGPPGLTDYISTVLKASHSVCWSEYASLLIVPI